MLNGRKRIRLHFGTLTESSVEGGLEGVETLGWILQPQSRSRRGGERRRQL